jgi:hypothetical protein
MISDDVTGKMVVRALNSMYGVVNYHTEMPEKFRKATFGSVIKYFDEFLLDCGAGWIPSKNLICNFRKSDCLKATFEYEDPVRFEDFLATDMQVFTQIFNHYTLLGNMKRIRSDDPVLAEIGKCVLYKGLFGYQLVSELIDIYYRLAYVSGHDSEYAYLTDSLLFNEWWNYIVNHDLLKLHYIDEEDGDEHVQDIWIKPIISVTPERKVDIYECMTVDYNQYLN